jgi:hypothetical protein
MAKYEVHFEDYSIPALTENFNEFAEAECDALQEEYSTLLIEFIQYYLSNSTKEEIDQKCHNLTHTYKSIKNYSNYLEWIYDNFADIRELIYLAELEENEEFVNLCDNFRRRAVIKCLSFLSIYDYEKYLDDYTVYAISANLFSII